MGNRLHKQKEYNLTIEGLEYAGKHSILYKLSGGDVKSSTTDNGLSAETITFKKFNIFIHEYGGRSTAREIYRFYWQQTRAMIFVVDSSARERLKDARYELHLTLKEESLENVVLLVLANKQDLPGAASVEEVSQSLDLQDVTQQCNIFGTSAMSGEGLYDAMLWLKDALKQKDHQKHEECKDSKTSCKGPVQYMRKFSESLKTAFVS